MRIACDDSRKKPPLASAEATRSGYARKFFHCQKWRLRVRATHFRPASATRNGVDNAQLARCVNRKNPCSAGVFINIDKRRRRVFRHYLHRCADALRCCRSARVARDDAAASTLP
jgi:hypothetical protein